MLIFCAKYLNAIAISWREEPLARIIPKWLWTAKSSGFSIWPKNVFRIPFGTPPRVSTANTVLPSTVTCLREPKLAGNRLLSYSLFLFLHEDIYVAQQIVCADLNCFKSYQTRSRCRMSLQRIIASKGQRKFQSLRVLSDLGCLVRDQSLRTKPARTQFKPTTPSRHAGILRRRRS